MNRKNTVATLICICLVVSFTYSLNSLLNAPNSNESKLASSAPENSLRLQSLTKAFVESGLSSTESGVSFLVAEAGFCAYGNVEQQVNLTKASEAFRGLEYQNQDYIIGSVPIPSFTESEDAHVYVHKTGWIVSYYTKTEYVAKIIKNFMTPSDNKIENAIAVVCSTLAIGEPVISYCDLRYPSANTLMVVGDYVEAGGWGPSTNNTFRILFPGEIANNISKVEWFCSLQGLGGLGMHNQYITSSNALASYYGTVDLVPSTKPDGLVQPTDLKLDTLTNVWVTAGGYNAGGITKGGFIILVHYD